MHIDPTPTEPGEISRAARNEIEFRVQVLTGLSELNIRVSNLEKNLNSVSSSAGFSEKEFKRYDGIKTGLGAAAAFFLVVGSAMWAVFTFFTSKH